MEQFRITSLKYTKIHQTNGWENLFLNEIIDNAIIHIKIYYSLIPKKLNHIMYHMKILHNQKVKMLKINCYHVMFFNKETNSLHIKSFPYI
jgi:hypothetical protein